MLKVCYSFITASISFVWKEYKKVYWKFSSIGHLPDTNNCKCTNLKWRIPGDSSWGLNPKPSQAIYDRHSDTIHY